MADSTRLLVVGVKWPPETFIRRRLEGLAARGFDVRVAASETTGPIRDERMLRVFRIPSGFGPAIPRAARIAGAFALGAFRSPIAAIRFAAAALEGGNRIENLRRLLPFAGLNADIVHFEWNFAAAEYLQLFDLMAKPVVISCRGAQVQVATSNPTRRTQTDLLPVTFQKASAVHCVSDAILREATGHGLDPAKARIIRPAVDPEVFCPAQSADPAQDQLRIAMTGAPIWRKGYEYALLALRHLLDRGVPARLDIVGGGSHSDLQRLRYTIQDLALDAVVRLRGPLHPTAVAEVLRQSNVFLLTSLSEGISNAVLEGMSCGLPVVTTDCGGMREAVTDGVEGFVVPVRSPRETANGLESLARDPDLRKQMGKAARARILAEFTLDQQITAWVDLYRSLHPVQEQTSPANASRARLGGRSTVACKQDRS